MTGGTATDQHSDRRRRRRWLVAGVVAILLAGWAAAAAWTGLAAYRDLSAARASFVAAAEQIREGDLAAGHDSVTAGVVHAEQSSARLARAYIAPLRVVPGLSGNIEAASVLSAAVRDLGRGAVDVIDAAIAVTDRGQEEPQGTDSTNGVALDYLFGLGPPLGAFADTLERTTSDVEAIRTGALVGPVERARLEYLDLADRTAAQVSLAADLADALPTFLGHDGPRRYLVGAVALSELRASGGLMGSWSVLTADRGRLTFDDFSDVDALAEPREDVAPPSSDFADRYRRYGALRQWRNANLSPDFPSSASVLLALWEAQGGSPLDGVIMADPVTFQRLVERAGAIEVPSVTTLTPENTLHFVALEAYAAFDDDDERKRVLGAVAASAFASAFEALEGEDLPETMRMLRDLTEGGHLRVYARDPEVQEALIRARVAGDVPDVEGEFAGVFVNNVAANKVDYFTARSIDHRVELLPDGVTRGTVEATFDNQAPTEGLPRVVLGPWTPHTEAGDNLSLVSFLCARTCAIDPLPPGAVDGGSELGRSVADVWLLVPAGEQRRLQFRTMTTDAWAADGQGIVVHVHHLVQPTLHDSDVRFRVAVPSGWDPVDLPDDARHVGDEIILERAGWGHIELELRLVPQPPEDAT